MDLPVRRHSWLPLLACGFLACAKDQPPDSDRIEAVRAALETYYPIDDLPYVGEAIWPEDINNNGVTVGTVVKSGNWTTAMDSHAFRQTGTNEIEELVVPAPNLSKGLGISPSGEIVGALATTTWWSGSDVAIRISPENAVSVFGPPNSRAYDVNQSGQIVGEYWDAVGARAFRITDGVLEDLPWLPSSPSIPIAIPVGIGPGGEAVGYQLVQGGGIHAFINRNGETRDLSDFHSNPAWVLEYASATNGRHVVGWGTRSGQPDTGFRLDLNTGEIIDFGWGHPRDVNRDGNVVGDLMGDAFFYSYDTGLIRLQAKIDPSLLWSATYAQGLNDHNQIVGWGYRNGQQAGFKLAIPNSEPCPTIADDCRAHEGTRNLVTGLCYHAPIDEGMECNDGNRSTVGDICRVGTCMPGEETAFGPGETVYASVVNIGTMQGQSWAHDINEDGVVVGADSATLAIFQQSAGFRWKAGEDLFYVPSTGPYTVPRGINNAGIISGYGTPSATDGIFGFRFDPVANSVQYVAFGGGSRVNQGGTMTGHKYNAQGLLDLFRANGSGVEVLANQLTAPYFKSAQAQAIDDAGNVVGSVRRSDEVWVAVRYSDARGGMEVLNDLLPAGSGWDLRNATGITPSTIAGRPKYIVGWGYKDGVGKAWRLTVGQDGSVSDPIDLGILPPWTYFPTTTVPAARDVNDGGDIVGGMYDVSVAWSGTPFVYVAGLEMIDLNKLIDPESGWNLLHAEAINNKREIVGMGEYGGHLRAYKMTLPAKITRPGAPPSPISLRVDAVVQMPGGKLKALFGYDSTASTIFVPTVNEVYLNGDRAPQLQPRPPAQLPPGLRHIGVYQPEFAAADAVSWKVDDQLVTASAALFSPLTPVPFGQGGLKVNVDGQEVIVKPDLDQWKATPPDPAANPVDEPQRGDEFYGIPQGTVSINPSGAATYTVPIAIPPAIGGMAPNLSLVYNSQAGNGIAGQGWELTGLSMIHRCPKTRVQDGRARPVVMDELVKPAGEDTDGICLDGQRLFEDPPGSGNYRGEREDFSIITRLVDEFVVFTKSGETRYYGHEAKTRVRVPRGRLDPTQPAPSGFETAIWALDLVVDDWGNFYRYHYNNNDNLPVEDLESDFLVNGLFVSQIDYTGHLDPDDLSEDEPPFENIFFGYDHERPDQRVTRFGEATIPRRTRLTSIATSASIYTLAYKPDDVFLPSRLEMIRRCSAWEPEHCQKDLVFEWDSAPYGWQPSTGPNSYALPTSILPKTGAQFVDLDGDGRQDLVVSKGGQPRQAWRNSGVGWETAPASWHLPMDLVNNDGFEKVDGSVRSILADVDGDGLADLVGTTDVSCPFICTAQPKVYINRIRSGNGWVLADAYGQVPYELPSPIVGPGWWNVNFAGAHRVADVNGDGKVDLLMLSWSGLEARINNGTGWEWTPEFDLQIDVTNYLIEDINRDGLPDLTEPAEQLKTIYAAWINNGRREGSSAWTLTHFERQSPFLDKWHRGDIDGDGLRDTLSDFHPRNVLFPNFPAVPADIRFATGTSYTTRRTEAFEQSFKEYAPPGWRTAEEPVFDPNDGRDSSWYDSALVDMNADGLADLLFQHFGNGQPGTSGGQLLINTGSAWRDHFGATPEQGPPGHEAERTFWKLSAGPEPVPFVPRDEATDGKVFIDLNGDGVTDVAAAASSSLNTFRPAVINRFPNGLAGTTQVSYSVITTHEAQVDEVYTDGAPLAAGTTYLAVPLRVATFVYRDNGVGSLATTRHTYSSLRGSAEGRGPLGFLQTTTADDLSGASVVTTYNQPYPYTGLPRIVERHDEGLLTATYTGYCFKSPSDRVPPPPPPPGPVPLPEPGSSCAPPAGGPQEARRTIFVYPRDVVDRSYPRTSSVPEPASPVPITTVTNYTFDEWGNPTVTVVRTNRGNESYQTATVKAFGDPNSRERRLGKVTESTVTTQQIEPTASETVHRTTHHYQPFGVAQALGLAKTKVEPNGGDGIEVHTAYDYDKFGNVVATTTCDNAFDQCDARAPGPPERRFRTTEVSFDPATYVPPQGSGLLTTPGYSKGRFPVWTKNAQDHVEYTVFDARFGALRQQTGPNGITSCHRYTDFGVRRVTVERCGSEHELVTTFQHYDAVNGPTNSRLVTMTRTPDGGASWVYSDVLGRTIETWTRAFDGRFSRTRTVYDQLGRVLSEFKPFAWPDPTALPYGTFREYDEIGRVKKVRQALGQIDLSLAPAEGVVATVYDGLTIHTDQTVTRDGAQQVRRRSVTKNVLGKVASVTDPDGVTVRYAYDAEGNLTDTCWGPSDCSLAYDPADKNRVHIEYDPRGRKKLMRDPDMGMWRYFYNGFGELVRQEDAEHEVPTTMAYDRLGRMVSKTDASGTSRWIFDVADGAGIGKLASTIGPVDPRLGGLCSNPHAEATDAPRATRWLRYNTFGDVEEAFECTDGDTFSTQFAYDTLGRQHVVRYPAVGGQRLALQYHYTRFGHLHFVAEEGIADSVYWAATAVNAAGQVTTEHTRNGVETIATRNPSTGWLMNATSTAHGDGEALVQKWAFAYDEAGNLKRRIRSDAASAIVTDQRFGYDKLDRLTSARVIAPAPDPEDTYDVTEPYSYDSLGNIGSKGSKVYSYSGCGGRPHAVCQINNGSVFQYDGNGNLREGNDRSITYNAANKPTVIQSHPTEANGQSAAAVDFIYDADGDRVVQLVANGSGGGASARTVYVGMEGTGRSLYERTTRGATIEHAQFLYPGGGAAFALRIVTQEGASVTAHTKYYHRDHLGSVTAMSDDAGRLTGATGPEPDVLGYDAWGGRMKPDGRAAFAGALKEAIGRRGFTGHEAIPDVGLVNMNGRVYDPSLGRFLTPDPTVQFVANLQSYNRYSYALNNPLRYTDPTGYSIHWYDTIGMTVAFGLGGAVCVASGGSGCWVIGVMATMYSTSTMLAQGASLEQVIVANAFGIFAGQLAGGLGSAIAEGIGHGALGPILGGAVSGAVSTAISTSLSGGELGWNVLIGAAQGAATAGVTWGVANAIRVSQASERRTSRSRVEGGGEADGLPRRRWRVTTNGVRAQENQDSCVAASTRNEIWLETDQDLSEAGIRRELAPGKRDWDAEGVEALLAVSVLRRHGVDASVSGVLSLTDLVEASKKGPLTIGTIPPGGGSHRVILLGTTVEVTPGTPIDENNRFFSILDSLSAPYGQPIHAISLTRSEFIARWDNALPVIKLPEYASP